MPARPLPFNKLPLFATDEQLSIALLGPGHLVTFRNLLPILERRGFPKIDTLIGGRYSPAVKAFFDAEYGLSKITPTAPDGPEDLNSSWKTKAQRKR